MCGIVGIISKKEYSIKDDLLYSLSRLEYRGYDSAGFVTREGLMKKRVGYLKQLLSSVKSNVMTDCAISHTRWATHGGISETNSHPHHNSDKNLFVVHNGIIENFSDMRKNLEKTGRAFVSDTDTEVIAHYFDYHLGRGKTMQKVILSFMEDAIGTFGVIIQKKGEKKLYAMKRDSPLVMGLGEDRIYLASDIYAFSHNTNKAIFFEDNECCVIDENSYSFFGRKGTIKKKVTTFNVPKTTVTKEKYSHFMIKEIMEQPEASSRLIESYKTIQKNQLKKFSKEVKAAKRVVFVACGTSYHASLVGVYMLNLAGVESHTVIASEFENFLLVDKDTLVIAISQSGETMDVVSVLKDVKEKGAKVASIVNVPYSTIQRLSKISLETLAGPEICVASTKVFTNQIIALIGIASELGYQNQLPKIPDLIEQTIKDNDVRIKQLAKKLFKKNDIFVLGKGLSYPIAREIALKLKEIPYIHAEGMMAGELKHGTIALIEPGVPVISLIPNRNLDMISSTKEVEARGADVITITNTAGEGDLIVPDCDEVQFTIYASVLGHLLSFYIAKLRKLPIDKPRNLAKSVTVK